jgi:hypothetical protein
MRILFLIYNKASLCGMSGDMLLARHRLEPMPNATISFSAHYAEQGETYQKLGDLGSYGQEPLANFALRSSSVDANGVVSFNYLDNGTYAGKSNSNNLTLNTSTGAISGRMVKRNVNYQVSEVRKSIKR